MTHLKGPVASLVVVLFSFVAANAWGQATSVEPNQTLDQVDAFNTQAVLDMAFDDPNAAQDFASLGIAGANLAHCKLTAKGLYCLETDALARQVVRQWPDTQKPLQYTDLLRCDDASIGLTGSPACTGLTVDLSGAIWVSGRKSDAVYGLVKVVPKVSLLAGCPGGSDWTQLTSNAALCARVFATGAGELADIDAVDGEAGAAFGNLGAGILAIENDSVVTYFNLDVPGADPTRFSDWALASGTRLLSTSLLQVPGANLTDPLTSYLVAATSKGKILSKPAASPATVSQVFDITAWEQAQDSGAASVTIDATTWSPCLSAPPFPTTCTVSGATLTSSGGSGFETKATGGATGLGISGGPSGAEIDLGESLTVTFPTAHAVAAIQLLFLFNGPEFNDKAEVVQIATDQGTFTLSVRNTQDDATADWSGPGSVSKCGATTASGSGCFTITNPFPSPVSSLTFTALPGNPPYAGGGSDESDFAIGSIETAGYALRTSSKTGRVYLSNRDYGAVLALQPNAIAFTALNHVRINNNQNDLTLSTLPNHPDGITVAPGIPVDLRNCTVDCALVKDANGTVAASLNTVKLAPGPSGITVYQVKNLPDCRYVPQVCRILLNGSPAASDDAARQDLINAGWIVPLDVANKLKPAAQLLNVAPLLPEDVTSLFDKSGVAPNGLPPLYVSRQYRGQNVNQNRFEALFFKTATGVTFLETFGGEIDVSKLAGTELGCFPVAGQLLNWDVITSVSETYKSVGGRYIDTITNVGCRNPTKLSFNRLSLIPYNLEVVPDTYGSTIRSLTPVVTVNNDAVFARLVQTLWNDVLSSRRDYACKQADPTPTGGVAPLNTATCDKLAVIGALANLKLDLCVAGTFLPKNAVNTAVCQLARKLVTDYQAALPTVATGPDVANRLGEQKTRAQIFLHVFDTRFLPSIKLNGFCREKNLSSCPP